STLLRGTVHTLLPEQEVWVTDWHNARDVGLADGSFGFDTYIEYLIHWLEVLGPETHVIAVCQPCVAALVATAVMSESGNDCTPRTPTLMAGPLEPRRAPTAWGAPPPPARPPGGCSAASPPASRSSGSSATSSPPCRCATPVRV